MNLFQYFFAILLSPLLIAGYTFYQVNYFDSDWENIDAGECILIMGAKVLENNQPDIMMSERIDTAKNYISEDTKAVFLSGGTADDTKTEAEVMRGLLVNSLIDSDKLILEKNSTSTLENLAYSKELILEKECETLDIISHDFHLARIKMTADRLGIAINRLIPTISEGGNSKERLEREYKAFLWYWLAWGWMR